MCVVFCSKEVWWSSKNVCGLLYSKEVWWSVSLLHGPHVPGSNLGRLPAVRSEGRQITLIILYNKVINP